MRRSILLAITAALVLAGCGSTGTAGETGPSSPAAASDPAAGASGTVPPAEGAVSDGPHEWADGLAVEIVSVESGPAATIDDPALDTEVRVTVNLTNNGTSTVSFGESPNTLDSGPDDDLFYGVNRYEAQGWYHDSNNLPTQLAPGTSATWVSEFTLPGSELGTLAYSISPTEAHERWTFTGLESLL